MRMQRHRRFDGGLRVEFSGVRDLEQHVLHHVAAERLRQRERFALEQHIVEAPGLGSESGRIAHLTCQCHQGMAHGAARSITSGPALSRARVGRMPVSAKRTTVDPRIGHCVDDLFRGSAEHARDDRRGGDAHQDDMVESHAIEAVLQREHALDLVRLDHCGEHVAYAEGRPALHDRSACEIVRYGKNAAQVIRRVTPLGRQPGVVEIEPADHRSDVECRLHGVELERGSRYARSASHRRARHHRPEQLRACGILQRLKAAGERVHQAIARSAVSLGALDGETLGVRRNRDQHGVRIGPRGRLLIVCGHHALLSIGTNFTFSGPT